MKASLPIEKEHRTAGLLGWTENGDGIAWAVVGYYKNGRLVDSTGNPPVAPK